MEEAAANRRYDELHKDHPFHDGSFTKWSEKASLATPYHFRDGVEIRVAEVDINPTDQFLSAGTAFSVPGTET